MNLKNILTNDGPNFEDRFISDYEHLREVVETLKRMGFRVVLTQGVYDLIHIGHLAYLDKAKGLGDILIVGVDSDKLTKKRKGDNRPIVPEDERLKTLVHLRSIDFVTLRHVDDGIDRLIECVHPDVLVTSETTSDFTEEKKTHLESICGEIVTLPAQARTSTSARIRELAISGAQQIKEAFLAELPEMVERIDKRIFHPGKEKEKE